MKMYWGGGTVPGILDLGTRWRGAVSFTPWPLYPHGKTPWYPLYRPSTGKGPEWASHLTPHFPKLHLSCYPPRHMSFSVFQEVALNEYPFQTLYVFLVSPFQLMYSPSWHPSFRYPNNTRSRCILNYPCDSNFWCLNIFLNSSFSNYSNLDVLKEQVGCNKKWK